MEAPYLPQPKCILKTPLSNRVLGTSPSDLGCLPIGTSVHLITVHPLGRESPRGDLGRPGTLLYRGSPRPPLTGRGRSQGDDLWHHRLSSVQESGQTHLHLPRVLHTDLRGFLLARGTPFVPLHSASGDETFDGPRPVARDHTLKSTVGGCRKTRAGGMVHGGEGSEVGVGWSP